jgi:hypothetical protein
MSTAVTRETATERSAAHRNRRPAPTDDTGTGDGFDVLPTDLRRAVVDALQARLDIPASDDPIIATLEPGWSCTPEQAAEIRLATLTRQFAERRRLLRDTISSTQVARLLDTTRQTPIDRLRQGTLLALRDGGSWRYPLWQFDPAGPDSVVDGLIEVLRQLEPNPFVQAAWLLEPQDQLGGDAPITALRRGQTERTIALAAQTGAV